MNRIEWVDVFKGLLIISMVVGHSTGYFNNYIYQFHMAAFFFASGYTIKLDKRNLWKTICYKAYTLLLPFITFFILMLILYKFVWFLYPDININAPFDRNVISRDASWFFKEFVSGRTWIAVLGACWFLPVLFSATIFAKILSIVTRNKTILSLLIAIALSLFVTKDFVVNISFIGLLLDLSILALVFVEIGICVKEYNVVEKINGVSRVILFIIALIAFYYFANYLHVSMDWPLRKFGKIWLDIIVVVNDVYLIVVVSQLLSKMASIKMFLTFLGKNTMGILVFHFLCLKVAYFVLGESIENFLPPKTLTGVELFVCVVIAIWGSVAIWQLMLRIPVLRTAIGQNKNIFLK